MKLAENFNGADLRNVCTEAGMFAIRDERDYVVHEVRHRRSSEPEGALLCKRIVNRTQQSPEHICQCAACVEGMCWPESITLCVTKAGLRVGSLGLHASVGYAAGLHEGRAEAERCKEARVVCHVRLQLRRWGQVLGRLEHCGHAA